MPTIYQCSSGGLKGFPVTLEAAPTLDNYTTKIETLDELIDFQWTPTVSALTTRASSTGSLFLQETDTQSTVVYNTVSYKLMNVQLTQAQHKSWLIEPLNNEHDLVIILKGTSPVSQRQLHLLFVIPLKKGGAAATDPAYLKTINTTASGGGLSSCFPSDLFAHYVTCFNGYTGHANTQDIEVFVSTTALPVSDSLLNTIRGTASTIGRLELPTTVVPSSTAVPTGSSIPLSLLATHITTTKFATATGLTNANQVATGTRATTTDAYKCVELDPDSVAADGNIHVDVETGTVASSTLTDILAERAALRRMVQPSDTSRPYIGIYTGYVLACLIVLGTAFGLWWFIFFNHTGIRFYMEIGFAFVICVLLLVGGGLGIFGKTQDMKLNGGYTAAAGFVIGFFYYMYFFVYSPSPSKGECNTKPGATAGPGAATAAAEGFKWTTTNVAILTGIIGVVAFLGGTIV